MLLVISWPTLLFKHISGRSRTVWGAKSCQGGNRLELGGLHSRSAQKTGPSSAWPRHLNIACPQLHLSPARPGPATPRPNSTPAGPSVGIQTSYFLSGQIQSPSLTRKLFADIFSASIEEAEMELARPTRQKVK